MEAGPQFALQLSLLIRGGWGPSSRAVLEPFIPVTLPPMNTTFTVEDTGDENLEITTVLPEFLEESKYNGSLVIFDRIYDEGKKRWLNIRGYFFRVFKKMHKKAVDLMRKFDGTFF